VKRDELSHETVDQETGKPVNQGAKLLFPGFLVYRFTKGAASLLPFTFYLFPFSLVYLFLFSDQRHPFDLRHQRSIFETNHAPIWCPFRNR